MQLDLLREYLDRPGSTVEGVTDPTTGLTIERYAKHSASAEAGAVFAYYVDEDPRTRRLLLWRTWDSQALKILFVGMNPSKADEYRDDPTCRKEQLWAAQWGYGGYVKTNVGTIVSTDPMGMLGRRELPWDLRRDYVVDQANRAGIVVCCWGTHPITHADGQPRVLVEALVASGQREKLHVLRLSKDGHPWHPLYLPNATTPTRWEQPYGL